MVQSHSGSCLCQVSVLCGEWISDVQVVSACHLAQLGKVEVRLRWKFVRKMPLRLRGLQGSCQMMNDEDLDLVCLLLDRVWNFCTLCRLK